jgi:hypothetical protein
MNGQRREEEEVEVVEEEVGSGTCTAMSGRFPHLR